MNKMDTRNKYFFGLGTIGRDMFYAFEANTIVYYMSMVLDLPLAVYIAASTCLTILRIFDALVWAGVALLFIALGLLLGAMMERWDAGV